MSFSTFSAPKVRREIVYVLDLAIPESLLRRYTLVPCEDVVADGTKHLDRYVVEFAGRLSLRDLGPISQFAALVAGMIGKRLGYGALIARNMLSSGARVVA